VTQTESIADVRVSTVRAPLRAILQLPRGAVATASGALHVFVRVRDAAGRTGWGEARPSPRWSDETVETVTSTIRDYLAPALIGLLPWDFAGIHAAMDAVIAPGRTRGQPIAKSALDMAMHDLLGSQLAVRLPVLLGRATADRMPLCSVVGADTADAAAQQAAEGWAAGYRGFKVKIGVHPTADLDMVAAVRAVAPTAYLWVDANQAYDIATARQRARALAKLGVDVFEQPTPARDILALRRLRADGGVPIAADESVFSATDLLQLLHMEALDILVVKVSKLSGLWPARRCLDLAEEAGIGILGSSLTESGLGAAASAALFGGYALAGPADINGPQFLQPAPDVPACPVVDGMLVLPPGPGIGIPGPQSLLP
jgi:L-alanine-DL-glutamate epimerase-like enolase superfamily enzyme